MSKLKSGLILNEGETLVMELEAELWAKSSNIFDRLVGAIFKIVFMILGFKKEGYVVITDKRVVEISKQKIFYIFDSGKVIRYLMPSSIKEVAYTKEPTCCCFCQAYHLVYESWTQKTAILLSNVNEAGAQRIVDAFYNSITNAK